MKIWALLVCLVALWSPGLCYHYYQTVLPNGQHVPHPCKPNYIWHGVGHLSSLGGGARNPFGQDFARLGHTWNRELCQLDSDHDGLTNGQELGDPDCVWSEGQIPAHTDNITHPGVCDPWGSERCNQRNAWVSCEVGEFKCDAIHQPDVRNITLRFPRTKVPAAETTYECFIFDFPSDEPYHIVAYTPYIDNPNVMHHIVVYACDSSVPLMDSPQECGAMGAMGCSQPVGAWTLGMTGDCLHPETGFRIGKGAATKVAFQFHWTNKQLIDHWYDSSGVTLYYTPKLRPYNAAITDVGQMHLHIPPGQQSLTTVGGCSSACTQRFLNGSIHVVAAINHMHYLGIRGTLQVKRDGTVVKNLTNDVPYSYDNPHMWQYPEPVEIRPGDELLMTCEFSSLSVDHTTRYGFGSYDEMCFGIIFYYPAANYLLEGTCTHWKDMDMCFLHEEGSCRYSQLANVSDPVTKRVIDTVLGGCRYGTCHAECPAAIAEARQLSPCLQGQTWEYMKDRLYTDSSVDPILLKMAAATESCDHQPVQSALSATSHPALPTTTESSQTTHCEHHRDMATEQPPGSSKKLDAAGTFLQLARELGSGPLFQNIIFNANQGK